MATFSIYYHSICSTSFTMSVTYLVWKAWKTTWLNNILIHTKNQVLRLHMQRMFCQERVAFNISHVLWFSFQILLFLIWPKVLEKGRNPSSSFLFLSSGNSSSWIWITYSNWLYHANEKTRRCCLKLFLMEQLSILLIN